MKPPVDTDRVRAVVSACPGVVRVEGKGPNGVSFDPTELEVHVVVRYGVVLPELGERLESELQPLLDGRSLTLVVDDVLTDAELAATQTGSGVPTRSPVAGTPAPTPDPAGGP